MESHNPDITYLAKTNFRGTDRVFGIKRKDRRQHMYVLGKSGTGKSTLLENMIIQNMQNGEGLCVIDPHGELVEKMVTVVPKERLEDVIYFNPSDTDFAIGFNVLQVDDPKYKHLIASGLMGIFTKIWGGVWSARMEYIMNNCILALLDTPGSTLMGIPRLLVDKDYRQYVISNVKDPVVRAFWLHEFEAWRDQFRTEAIQPIQNKVGQFLSNNIIRNIVGQQKSTINIFDIMNNRKIFLVNLSKGRMGEDNSALLGAMIITKIQLAAMERVRILEADRKDFYLYVDEFQNFVTDSFASILSEARKYRLSLTIAHQYIAQLETTSSAVKDAVFGNVGTMIVFRVGAEDGDALEGEFEPEFVNEDFVNLPNYHIYLKLMVDGITSRPFSAKTLSPIPIQESDETRDLVVETSRRLYAKERATIETDIERWSSSVPGSQDDENSVSKFKATCLNCNKQIYVPFEPIPGKPIYCKECMVKIKTGEIQAVDGFKLPKPKDEVKVSYDELANLGIEFSAADMQPKKSYPPQNKPFQTKEKRDFVPKKELNSRGEERPKNVVIKAASEVYKTDLSSIIHEAVLEVKKNSPQPEKTFIKPQITNSPTVSLKDLLLKNNVGEKNQNVQTDTKTVKPASVFSLKNAIDDALKNKQSVSPTLENQERQVVSEKMVPPKSVDTLIVPPQFDSTETSSQDAIQPLSSQGISHDEFNKIFE